MADPNKVLIVFSGVGSAPVLKEDARKVLINRDSQFLKVIVHLRKLLGLDKTDSLFIYVKDSFTPNPRELVGVLADIVNGPDSDDDSLRQKVLPVHYSLTQAWG